jgi:hypothetical protein
MFFSFRCIFLSSNTATLFVAHLDILNIFLQELSWISSITFHLSSRPNILALHTPLDYFIPHIYLQKPSITYLGFSLSICEQLLPPDYSKLILCYLFIPSYSLTPQLITGWTVLGWSPGVGQDFLDPSQSWGPPNLLYNVYQVSFLGQKQVGHGVKHPPFLAPGSHMGTAVLVPPQCLSMPAWHVTVQPSPSICLLMLLSNVLFHLSLKLSISYIIIPTYAHVVY